VKPKKRPRVLLDISEPLDDEFRFVLSDAQKRVGYAVFFVEVIQAPPRDERCGHDGAFKYMMDEFNLPAGLRGVLVRVLHDVVQCAKGGVEYTGDRKAGSGGHNKMITTGSVEEKMVADSNFGDSNFGFQAGQLR